MNRNRQAQATVHSWYIPGQPSRGWRWVVWAQESSILDRKGHGLVLPCAPSLAGLISNDVASSKGTGTGRCQLSMLLTAAGQVLSGQEIWAAHLQSARTTLREALLLQVGEEQCCLYPFRAFCLGGKIKLTSVRLTGEKHTHLRKFHVTWEPW